MSSANRTRKQVASFVLATGLLGCLFRADAVLADDWFDLNGKALATFEFEGSPLPTSVEQLKQQFPTARLVDHNEVSAAGIECYIVTELPAVDAARFFFCDGHLYQFEAQYSRARIDKLGGMPAVLQKLLHTWGAVDHAGESRWTWQRPMYSRRADFYARPEGAQLTITDTGWMTIASGRIERAESSEPMNLGF